MHTGKCWRKVSVILASPTSGECGLRGDIKAFSKGCSFKKRCSPTDQSAFPSPVKAFGSAMSVRSSLLLFQPLRQKADACSHLLFPRPPGPPRRLNVEHKNLLAVPADAGAATTRAGWQGKERTSGEELRRQWRTGLLFYLMRAVATRVSQ